MNRFVLKLIQVNLVLLVVLFKSKKFIDCRKKNLKKIFAPSLLGMPDIITRRLANQGGRIHRKCSAFPVIQIDNRMCSDARVLYSRFNDGHGTIYNFSRHRWETILLRFNSPVGSGHTNFSRIRLPTHSRSSCMKMSCSRNSSISSKSISVCGRASTSY
jgi:hypothetical protein